MHTNTAPNMPTPPHTPAPRSLTITLWATLLALTATLFGLFASPSRSAGQTRDFSWLPEGAAQGAVVSQTGGLTCMTTDVGNEDLLLVLDSRNEELFVYRTDSKAGMQLLQRYPVPQMFVDARGRSQGR